MQPSVTEGAYDITMFTQVHSSKSDSGRSGATCQSSAHKMCVLLSGAMLTILIAARRCKPSLLAKVLFALKGGRRLRCLATDPIGIADALSVLSRPISVLLLAIGSLLDSAKVSSAGGLSACEDPESERCVAESPWNALMSGDGGSPSWSESLLSPRPRLGADVEATMASLPERSAQHGTGLCALGTG